MNASMYMCARTHMWMRNNNERKEAVTLPQVSGFG